MVEKQRFSGTGPETGHNIGAAIGDEVIRRLTEAGQALSILALEQAFSEEYELPLADSYRKTRAAVADLEYLRLVTVDNVKKTVALSSYFYDNYCSTTEAE